MRNIATRKLWATQTLLLRFNTGAESDLEYIQSAGRELMRRTDTTAGRRYRAALEQDRRRTKKKVRK